METKVPITPQPVLLESVATGALGVLTGMGCRLLPREPRKKSILQCITPSAPDQHAGFPSVPGARLTARGKVW